MKKTPIEIIEKFEQAIQNIAYGTASVICYIRGGKLRFVVSKEESFLESEFDSKEASHDR